MEDLQTLGNFVVCQLASHISENFIGVCALRTICQLHEAGYALAKLGIWYADYSGVADPQDGSSGHAQPRPEKYSNRRE